MAIEHEDYGIGVVVSFNDTFIQVEYTIGKTEWYWRDNISLSVSEVIDDSGAD